MVNNISEELVAKLSELVNAQMGLYFPKKNWKNLKRGLGFAASEFGFEDTESLGRWLLSSPLTKDRIHALACHLTIGETYFFRDLKTFDALREQVLPELLFSRKENERRLRIWSAGCSSGEEPYSIAILLTRLIPDIANWNITILATDINPRSLQKASEGVYTNWSFRNPPPWLKQHYFKENGKHFEIRSQIKRMVTFSTLNLAEDVYPSLSNNTNAMDIIFCRNVIMYFSDTLRKRVSQNFHHALVDGGWLIVSPSEANSVFFPQFVTVNFPGAIFFMKGLEQEELRQFWFARDPEIKSPFAPVQTPGELGGGSSAGDQLHFPYPPQGGNTHPSPLLGGQPLSDFPLEEGEGGVSDQSISAQRPPQKPQLTPYDEALEFYEQGRYKETVEKLIGIYELSSNEQAVELLTRAYANQGKLAEALEWCDKAIIVNKLNPCFYYLRATILQEQNQLVEAMSSLRRTLFLAPNFVLACFAMGNIAQQQGKFEESKKHLSNVRRLLHSYNQEDVLPESDGMTAGRLKEIINIMLSTER